MPKFAEKNFNNIKGPVEKEELRKKREGTKRRAKDCEGRRWMEEQKVSTVSQRVGNAPDPQATYTIALRNEG